MPRRKNNAYSTSMCGSELTIEYIGKPAHAMVAPWEGINALDAVTLLQTSIGLLRQQIHPTDRIRGVVLEAGKRSGIIPEYAQARYCVRSASMERYKILKKKFVNCLEAAALATGCELRTTWLPAYWDIRTNEKLAARYVDHLERQGVKFTTPSEQKANGDCYSTDMGNVTYVVPSIHPTFALDCPDGDIHTREFASAAATDDSHRRALMQGKSMASTCLEVLTDDDFAALLKEEFDETSMSLAQDPEMA
jgi:metal-dependent amidase/aminoacylase/carboxypeptidase family protein